MGLDLTAYSAMARLNSHGPSRGVGCPLSPDLDSVEDEGTAYHVCFEAGHVEVWCYDGFETHALAGMGDLAPKIGYEENVVGVSAGWWEPTGLTQTAWWGSSYGGHTFFRELLGKVVGITDLKAQVWEADPLPVDLPFYELLNFADNEGALGTDACRALLADFTTHRDAFHASLAADLESQWWRGRYKSWTEGLELAALDGFIYFH